MDRQINDFRHFGTGWQRAISFKRSQFLFLLRVGWMQIHHVLRETGNKLIGWLLQLLFDVILQVYLYVVGPGIRVCSLSTADWRNLLPIIVDLFDLLHNLERLFAAQVREKLLNMRQLLNRYLIIELLVIRTVVLIILRNDFFFTLFGRVVIDLLLLLLVLVELKLAARATSGEV